MTLANFIKENRGMLDDLINRRLHHVPATASCNCHRSGTDNQHEPTRLNDKDRRDWILNDEGLYNWARAEGVRI